MHMGLTKSRAGYAHKLSALLELRDICAAAAAHARPQPPGYLEQYRRHRDFVGSARLDTFRYKLAEICTVFLKIPVCRPLFHRADLPPCRDMP